MADPGTRVAVYLDFDNIVISRYDQVHGRNQFSKDRGKGLGTDDADPQVAERFRQARVDVGAIIDFASSYGTLVLTRAYADWSAPVNADYRGQLVGRAVDLVQLFPAAAYAKNGADIRLAVDAVEDMFRLPDLTHVVIVAGDSDYIPLAQRCRRLGRYVVAIGVAGSTSRSLAAACDELITYDALPGIEDEDPHAQDGARAGRRRRPRRSEASGDRDGSRGAEGAASGSGTDLTGAAESGVAGSGDAESGAAESGTAESGAGGRGAGRRASVVPEFVDAPHDDEDDDDTVPSQDGATRLLERALRLGHEKDDADWLHSSTVKSQMKRMDPSFNEKALGFRSFTDFVRSREEIADLDESGSARLVRLKG